jgi:hypothetical protein
MPDVTRVRGTLEEILAMLGSAGNLDAFVDGLPPLRRSSEEWRRVSWSRECCLCGKVIPEHGMALQWDLDAKLHRGDCASIVEALYRDSRRLGKRGRPLYRSTVELRRAVDALHFYLCPEEVDRG